MLRTSCKSDSPPSINEARQSKSTLLQIYRAHYRICSRQKPAHVDDWPGVRYGPQLEANRKLGPLAGLAS
jgi:hypothetical protein